MDLRRDLGGTWGGVCGVRPAEDGRGWLVTATLFGFTAVSGILAVLLLPRPGSDRARHAAITLQCFMVFLGFAVLICSFFLLLLMPVGFIALMGAFAAGCAVAGLLSAPTRDHCRPHPTVR